MGDVEVGQGQDQDPVEETGIHQKGEDREDTDISLCYLVLRQAKLKSQHHLKLTI